MALTSTEEPSGVYIYQNTTGHEQGVGRQTCSSILDVMGLVAESDKKGGSWGALLPFDM